MPILECRGSNPAAPASQSVMVIRSNVGLLSYRHGAREIPSTRGRNRWPLLADEDARRAACRGVRNRRQAVRVSYSIQTAGANEQRLPVREALFKERVMLRAEQFRQDTAKFWSDLEQKRKVLATEPQAKATSRRRVKAAPRPANPKSKKSKH